MSPIIDMFNNRPIYASTADAATCFRMLHTVCIVQLRLIGYVGLDTLPKNYWPPILDCDFSSFKYD